MTRLAKLHKSTDWERRIWAALIKYANTGTTETFTVLVYESMTWIGGRINEPEICDDFKKVGSLENLASRYLSEIRVLLSWLARPERGGALADRGFTILMDYANLVQMAWERTADFKDSDKGSRLISEWPASCDSVITPICRFIRATIYHRDVDRWPLRDAIPIGLCEGPACGRFFLVQRKGRKRFCSDTCRSANAVVSRPKEENAARMARYRANLKDMSGKPLRVAKRANKKATVGIAKPRRNK